MEHSKAKERQQWCHHGRSLYPSASPVYPRLREVAFWGTHAWREKCHELDALLQEVREEGEQSEARREQVEQENRQLRQRISELEARLAQPQAVQVPLGEVPGGQQYGAGMIALCVNLARKIGLRPTEHALHVVFEWLGVQVDIPSYQTMRLWMQRIGLDRVKNAKAMPGGVWLTDHTNQIGKEKVLVMLRSSGRPLATPRCASAS